MSGKLLTFVATLKKRKFEPPILYGVSSRQAFPDLRPLHYLELLFQTRAHILQWREKDLSPEQNRPFVRRGAQLAQQTGKLFLVNSQVELALQERAHGVHLTSDQELPQALELRDQSGAREFLIGKSVHSVKEAEQAEREGADYVLLGPIFDPISKGFDRHPLGLSALREAAQMLYIPVLALGGIDQTTFPEVLKTNAIGVAGISWLQEEIKAIWANESRQSRE